MSPGMAPATAIGPVTIWPARTPGLAASIASNSGGDFSGEPGGGITSSRPETHCTSTESPDSIVWTGGNSASNTPIRTVSGAARRVWKVMVRSYAMDIAGRLARKSVAFSKASATWNTVASWNGLPTICNDVGSPAGPNPEHTDIAG